MTYQVMEGMAKALYFRPCSSLIQDYPDLKLVLTKTESSEPDLYLGLTKVTALYVCSFIRKLQLKEAFSTLILEQTFKTLFI